MSESTSEQAAQAGGGLAWVKAAVALTAIAAFAVVASLLGPAGTQAGLDLGAEELRTPGTPPERTILNGAGDKATFGQLVGREYVVQLLPGEYEGEALYTVRAADTGRTLAERITASEADRLFPKLNLDALQAQPHGSVDLPSDRFDF